MDLFLLRIIKKKSTIIIINFIFIIICNNNKGTQFFSGTKNIGTQTAGFDSFAEFIKLQEQVKQLQLQYDVLQQYMEMSKKCDLTTQYRQLYTEETSKSIVERHSCSCKGNCSSRVCGCMKKAMKCSSICKCNDKICKNQEVIFLICSTKCLCYMWHFYKFLCKN